MALNNKYVKFMKGSLNAYNNLTPKDPSTLYFITTELNNSESKIELYLGNQLISGGNNVSVDLTDINNAIEAIQNKLEGVNENVIKEIQLAVANLVTLSYTTIESVDAIEDLITNNPESVDKYIYLVPDENGSAHDEYMVIKTFNEDSETYSYKIEAIGSLNVKLDNYYTKEEINSAFTTVSRVENLENLLSAKKDEEGNVTSIPLVETVGDLVDLLGYTPAKEELPASLTIIEKVSVLEKALEIDENGTITSAPIGKLEELLLYKDSDILENEKPKNLVEAINILTEQMSWGELTE